MKGWLVTLTESEQKVLIRILRWASEVLSLRTCGDFDVEDTLENRQLAKSVACWAGDPDTQWAIGDGEIMLVDWIIAGYLADKLERAVKGFGLVHS